jgi:hypothetical protein
MSKLRKIAMSCLAANLALGINPSQSSVSLQADAAELLNFTRSLEPTGYAVERLTGGLHTTLSEPSFEYESLDEEILHLDKIIRLTGDETKPLASKFFTANSSMMDFLDFKYKAIDRLMIVNCGKDIFGPGFFPDFSLSVLDRMDYNVFFKHNVHFTPEKRDFHFQRYILARKSYAKTRYISNLGKYLQKIQGIDGIRFAPDYFAALGRHIALVGKLVTINDESKEAVSFLNANIKSHISMFAVAVDIQDVTYAREELKFTDILPGILEEVLVEFGINKSLEELTRIVDSLIPEDAEMGQKQIYQTLINKLNIKEVKKTKNQALGQDKLINNGIKMPIRSKTFRDIMRRIATHEAKENLLSLTSYKTLKEKFTLIIQPKADAKTVELRFKELGFAEAFEVFIDEYVALKEENIPFLEKNPFKLLTDALYAVINIATECPNISQTIGAQEKLDGLKTKAIELNSLAVNVKVPAEITLKMPKP